MRHYWYIVLSWGVLLTLDLSAQSPALDIYSQGNTAIKKGNVQSGLELYDKAIDIEGSNEKYLFGRGQAKVLLGDDLGALDDFHAALKIDPHYHIAHYKRALIYYRRGNYKQSVKDLTYLINHVESYHYSEYVTKGKQYEQEGGPSLAGIHTLDELMADMYDFRAKCYEKMGFKTPTMIDYNKAIEYNNHDANYYVNRGQFKLSIGDEKSAISDFRKAININPHHRAALKNLSFLVDEEERSEINMILYGEGDKAMTFSKQAFEDFQKGLFTESLENYDSALLLRSDNASDLMNRGIVHAKLGSHRSAIKDFKTSVYHDNSLTKNYVLAGNSYQSIGNYRYAIEYYQKYLDNAGPDASVLYNLGLAYMKFQDDDEACQTFRKAIEMGEERAEAPMNDVCFQ